MASLKTRPDGRHLVRWKTPDRKSPKKYFPAGRKPAAKRFKTSVEHSVLVGTYVDPTLIDAGQSVKVVQDRLGHATARQTLDTYAHLWPSSDDRARGAVDAVLGQLGSSVGSGDVQVS